MAILADNRHNVYKVDNVVSTPQTSAARITLSTSLAFVDKTPLKGVASFNMFAPQNMLPSDITAHILAGRAILPFAHKAGKRGHAYALSGQMMGLDFDGKKGPCVTLEMLQNHPMGGYIFFAHETPSSTPAHPRTRAYILIDTAIESAEEYECLVKALHTLFSDYGPDESCTDSSRPFFGSKNAAHWTNLAAVLPLALLREHAEDIARAQRQAAAARPIWHERAYSPDEPLKSPLANKRLQGFKNKLQNLIEAELHRISSSTEGDRDTTLTSAAGKVLNLAATPHCPYSTSDAIEMMVSAAVSTGLSDRDARKTIASVERRYARRPLIVPDFNDDTRGQNSARIENSPVRELTRYDVDSDGEPLASLAQNADNTDEVLSRYSSQLPDNWMFALEDAAKGGYAPALLNAINGMLRRGELRAYVADAAYTTTDAIVKGLSAAGYTFNEEQIKKALKSLVKAKLIEKIAKGTKSAHFLDRHSLYSDSCAVLGPLTTNASVYRLLDDEALLKLITARMHEGLLDSFYAHKSEDIDAERAALFTPEAMRSTLEALQGRKLNTLNAEAVYAAVPDELKVKPRFKKDKETQQENARRKAAFYTKLRAIAAPATVNNLIVAEVSSTAAAAIAAQVNQQLAANDPHNLIGLKWSRLKSSYKRRMELLENTSTTPFTELSLDSAKAQLSALRRARHAPYDHKELTGVKQAELLHVDSRSAAVRMSSRLGLHREEQIDKRPLIVKRRANWDVILDIDIASAIKSAVKPGEYPKMVHSLDANGKEIDSATPDRIDELHKGAAFKLTVQKPSLVHIGAMPERTERTAKGKTAAPLAVSDMPETPQRRVHRTTLYTPEFVYHNTLRHVISHNEQFGMWYLKSDENVLYESPQDALTALLEMPQLKAAS